MAAVAVAALRRQGAAVECVRALEQVRPVADQAGLSASERLANLEGALGVVRPSLVDGRRVVIADDVITTGASLAAAAQAVSSAGGDVIAAAAVAATPRRCDGTQSALSGGVRCDGPQPAPSGGGVM
jgi:predicted amidophosphoribosyltransferase